MSAPRPGLRLSCSRLSVLEIVAWCALLLGAVFYWMLSVNTLPYGPDSWSYYELSQSVFSGDFYRVHGIRQFQSIEPYSMSFPPLWPITIALAASVWPIGPAIMSTLALAAFLAMVAILESQFRRLYQQPDIGLITGLGLLCLSPYLDELKSGGSLPLALLLLSLICLVWLKKPSPRNAFVLGLLVGMVYLLRFDAAPAVIAVLMVYLGRGLFQGYRENTARGVMAIKAAVRLALSYMLALALAISPYVIYSLEHFGTPWASDNSIVALSVQAGVFVSDFWPSWPATALEQPLEFFDKVLNHAGPFLRSTVFNVLMPLLAVIGAYVGGARARLVVEQRFQMDALLLQILLLLMAWSATLAGYLLTGYDFRRYYLPETLLLLIATGIVVNCLSKKVKNSLVVIVVLLLGNEIFTQVERTDFDSRGLIRSEQQLRLDDNIDAYTRCYDALGAEGKVMFMDYSVTRIAALSKIDTTLMPMNLSTLSAGQFQLFVDRFNIRAVVTPPNSDKQWLSWFHQAGFTTRRCGDYPGFFSLQAEPGIDHGGG